MPLSIDYSKVADIYDEYVTADFDIPFWVNEASKIRGKVLELTAGTGRISVPLLKAGVDLTCVDYCAEMVAVLRKKIEREGLACTIIEMDMTELSLPLRYDLIFIPFNTFSEIIDPQAQRKVLSRIRRHLADDGEFICTLHNPSVKVGEMDGSEVIMGTFQIRDGSSLVVKRRVTFEETSRVARGVQLYEFRDEDGRIAETRSVEVCFRLPERGEFEELAESADLDVADMYGGYDYARFDAGASQFMIWRLKPERH